jgi:hypothetical protein
MDNLFWKVLLVCEIVLLIYSTILIFFRKKHAEALLKEKEAMLKRIINYRTLRLKVYKLTLWWLPVLLILLFIVNYFVVPEIQILFMVGAIFVLELLVFVEFLYTRWLLRYLAEHKAEQGQIVKEVI